MWARLHFRDGGTLDLSEPVNDWDRDSVEQTWRAHGVRVEWLRSRRGRLDRALDSYVAQIVDNPADSAPPPE